MRRIAAFLFLALLLAGLPARGQGAPAYPKGSSSQEFAGLRFQLVVPADFDPAKTYALLVVLHGLGGEEKSMAQTFEPLSKEGFVVCAPKSTGQGWDAGEVEKVKEIVRHLMPALSIGEGRLHGVGFSNGGWNLASLVFDEKLPFASGVWIAAGYNGGKVPKRARTTFGALALAGSEDGNKDAAEKTVDLLADKVRSVEVRIEPGVGHAMPRGLLPYCLWWIRVMDGWYVPGDDMSFQWTADPEAAKPVMAQRKTGGLLWFYTAADTEDAEARRVQQEVFFHPLVRRFGAQAVAVKLERTAHEALFASYRLKKTPAVVVLKPDGSVAKALEGEAIKDTALAKALRDVVPDKSVPK